MRRCLIVAALFMVSSAAPALADNRTMWFDADGIKHRDYLPWQVNEFDRDSFANRSCYDDGCYFRGCIGGKHYHTYYPGIYRYDYQHRYHRTIPQRYGLFSKYRHHGRYLSPFGYDFTTKRFNHRYRRYSPSRGQVKGRHTGSSVRSGVDRIRERARFGRR